MEQTLNTPTTNMSIDFPLTESQYTQYILYIHAQAVIYLFIYLFIHTHLLHHFLVWQHQDGVKDEQDIEKCRKDCWSSLQSWLDTCNQQCKNNKRSLSALPQADFPPADRVEVQEHPLKDHQAAKQLLPPNGLDN